MTPSRSNTTPWKASARARPSATVGGLPPDRWFAEQPGWRPAAPACYKDGHDRQPECGGTMVAAAPFRGLRFEPDVVGEHAQVTTPPYDVISPEARDAYEAMSPYNMVRLILARPGPDDDPGAGSDGAIGYRHAADLLAAWWAEGVLRRDPSPCLYVYEEIYQLKGEPRVQRGVLASVALDDSRTWVVPHERTMAAPVADRLRLLEATEANLSPVFGVYAGAGGPAEVLDDVTGTRPALDCVDETGVRHRLWVVDDPERIAAWCGRMTAQRVLIADGHHRYRTSLAYRDAMRAAGGGRPGPWDELLMFLVDADLHGPAVLATQAGRDRRMLDVEVLHGPVLSKRLGVSDFEGRVAYQSDLAAAVAAVDQGAAASVLILRPAR